MNIYACWHQGMPGYCFEHPHSGWWFVPELGQRHAGLRRHLGLEDFIFANRFEWQLEIRRQRHRAATPWWRQLLANMFSPNRAHSIAGLLLLPLAHF